MIAFPPRADCGAIARQTSRDNASAMTQTDSMQITERHRPTQPWLFCVAPMMDWMWGLRINNLPLCSTQLERDFSEPKQTRMRSAQFAYQLS
jgi:hypothetical protein